MKVAIVESDESSPLLRDALTDIFRRYGRKDEAPSWSGGNKRQHTMGMDELLSYLGRCGSAKDPLKQAETILHGHASVGRGESTLDTLVDTLGHRYGLEIFTLKYPQV